MSDINELKDEELEKVSGGFSGTIELRTGDYFTKITSKGTDYYLYTGNNAAFSVSTKISFLRYQYNGSFYMKSIYSESISNGLAYQGVTSESELDSKCPNNPLGL